MKIKRWNCSVLVERLRNEHFFFFIQILLAITAMVFQTDSFRGDFRGGCSLYFNKLLTNQWLRKCLKNFQLFSPLSFAV